MCVSVSVSVIILSIRKKVIRVVFKRLERQQWQGWSMRPHTRSPCVRVVMTVSVCTSLLLTRQQVTLCLQQVNLSLYSQKYGEAHTLIYAM